MSIAKSLGENILDTVASPDVSNLGLAPTSHPDASRSGPVTDATANAPFLSVVVPAYSRPESLARCLEALCAQTLPREQFEVIVCDDASPEPLAPAVARFAGRLALSLVTQSNAGPAAARNRGARQARGQLLAFTDDDCIPSPDWLERLTARFEKTPTYMIGGAITNTLPDDPYATATHLVMRCVYDYHDRQPANAQRFYSTTNLAVPAERFWAIGGFDESFQHAAGEDYDFCVRWQEAGFPSTYASEATVGHAHGHTLPSFWRQHFGYGRALLRVRQEMAHQKGRGGVQLESPRFYGQLVMYPLKQGYGARGWLYGALILLSQIATAAGGACELLLESDGDGTNARRV